MRDYEVDIVEYGGLVWRRYPESEHATARAYYSNGSRGIGEQFLHRRIWVDNFGEIPEGSQIHHKDEDPGNNDISNLECLTPRQHRAKHKMWGGRRDENLKHMKVMNARASEWHKSEEGRAWHSTHGVKVWKQREPILKQCENCGVWFDDITRRAARKCCSAKCKAALRRLSGVDNEARSCQQCKTIFVAEKHKKTRFCSKSCAQASIREAKIKSQP